MTANRTVGIIGLAAILLLTSCKGKDEGASEANPAGARVAVDANGSAASFTQVYERVSPAVVSINAARVVEAPVPITDYILGRPGAGRPVLQSMSAGSGFFISADGHILTNDHVVGQANRLQVVLLDGRELPARIVGRDPESDLAVLKVEGRDFAHVNFSAAANPKVGEAVIAIGNPFGLGTTATHGIVSAFGRNIGSPYVDYIQLDAPINQGNSGGPTFNERGEVVGVNTAIFSPSGGSVGIGFAIPASTASTVARALMDSGVVARGYIGASLLDLPSGAGGAMVAGVVVPGPAHRAGLRPGDVITAVKGEEIERAVQVIRAVVSSKPADTLRLSVRRNNASLSLNVPVGPRPAR